MQRRSCKRRLEHEGIQEKRIGWEAWTRTRIARSRVWSPTNWTTSQPTDAPRCDGSIEEQKGIAAGSRGSGEPRFDRIRVNGNGVGRQPGDREEQGRLTVRSVNGNHAAVLNFVFDAAPDDAAGEKSGKPDGEMENIAKGKKPEAAAQDRVADSRDAHNPGHGRSQEEIEAEICRGEGG